MLRVDSSPGLGSLVEPARLQRDAHELTTARASSIAGRATAFRHLALDRSAGFHVQTLSASHTAHAAPPPRREAVLAAYHAHLASRIRYYGPLTPVDLRV